MLKEYLDVCGLTNGNPRWIGEGEGLGVVNLSLNLSIHRLGSYPYGSAKVSNYLDLARSARGLGPDHKESRAMRLVI